MRNAPVGNPGARPPCFGRAGVVRSITCTATALILVGTSDAHAQQQSLRWRLKGGEVLNYKTDHETRLTVKSGGRERKQNRSQTIYYHWTVASVSDDGVAEITHKIDRLAMTVEAPPLMPFRYDTKAPPADVPEPFESEVQQMKATIGAAFSFQMKPTGEISNIRIPEETLKAFRDALPQETAGQAMFSEQGLKDQLLQSTPPTFPDGPVEVGRNWASKPTNLLRIAMETRVSIEPTESLTVKIRSQESKGSLIFDTATGRVVSTRGTQKMDMSISSMGQTVDQITENESTMTLEP
jgi:hypothetical protein